MKSGAMTAGRGEAMEFERGGKPNREGYLAYKSRVEQGDYRLEAAGREHREKDAGDRGRSRELVAYYVLLEYERRNNEYKHGAGMHQGNTQTFMDAVRRNSMDAVRRNCLSGLRNDELRKRTDATIKARFSQWAIDRARLTFQQEKDYRDNFAREVAEYARDVRITESQAWFATKDWFETRHFWQSRALADDAIRDIDLLVDTAFRKDREKPLRHIFNDRQQHYDENIRRPCRCDDELER
jgi:hypothetical protein